MPNDPVPNGSNKREPTFSSVDCELIQLDDSDLESTPLTEAQREFHRRSGEKYRRDLAEQREREERAKDQP